MIFLIFITSYFQLFSNKLNSLFLQVYIKKYVFLIQIFFLLLTLFLIHWKLPETKNKSVGIIKQELHYLQDWNRTVNTMPDFSPPADIEAEFANEITPSKLHINDDDLHYIDDNTYPQMADTIINRPRKFTLPFLSLNYFKKD